MPIVKRSPMLAIPRWGDKARLPKPQMVVKVLYRTAFAVLVFKI